MAFADLHSDVMIEVARRRLLGERRVLADGFAPDLLADGVGLQLLTVGGDFPLFAGHRPGDGLESTLALVDAFWQEQAEAPELLRPVLVAGDVAPDEDTSVLRCVLHLEGAGVVTGPELLRSVHRLGVRSLGLTWNGPNALADGCAVPRGAGLTALGVEIVAEAGRLGMVLDVSHLSDRGALDVCVASAAPVIASHSNARAVHDHPRNLPDELLDAIAASGGVIGVCAYPPLLAHGRRPGLDDLVRQIDHIAERVGVAHVALGPDFIWYLHDSWFDSAGVREFKAELSLPFPTGMETSAGFRALGTELVGRGYARADVVAILGGNGARVVAASLSAD